MLWKGKQFVSKIKVLLGEFVTKKIKFSFLLSAKNLGFFTPIMSLLKKEKLIPKQLGFVF